MKKFAGWLLLFLVLTLSIPLFTLLGWFLVAKLTGVLTVLVFSFSVRYWLYITRKQYDPKERIRLNLNDRYWMKLELESYNRLNPTDKKAYEDRVGVFLANVPILFSSGSILTDRKKAIVLAFSFVDHLGLEMDINVGLPKCIIIEDGEWSGQALKLDKKDVVVIPNNVWENTPFEFSWNLKTS